MPALATTVTLGEPWPPDKPEHYPLALVRGDGYVWHVIAPADLTGTTIAAQIRRTPDHRDAVDLACTLEASNLVKVELPAARSARLPVPAAVWDLEITWPGGPRHTVLAGPVKVTPDVTRP